MAKALDTVLALRMTMTLGSVPPPCLDILLPHLPPVFYWTHLSYLPMWLLLILHGPNFWKWLLVPGTLFFLEKTISLAASRMAALNIVEVNLLPSKVQRGPEEPGGVPAGGVQHLGTLLDLHPQEIGSTMEETSKCKTWSNPARVTLMGGGWWVGRVLLKARCA